MKPKPSLKSFLFCFGTLLSAPTAIATTYTWTKAVTAAGSTDNWSAGTNWSAAPVSAATTTLVFGYSWTTNSTAATNTLTNNVANPFQLNVLTLGINTPTAGSGSSVGLVNIAGSPLDFVSNGATTPQVNLSQNKSAGQNATFDTQTGVILDANTLFTGNGTATFTISSAISGAGTFTKSGTSTLTLSSATNSFSGGITVNGGTLAVTSTGTLGSNVNTNNIGIGAGAFLTLAGAGNTGANQTITLTSTAGSLAVLGLGSNAIPAATIAQADTNGGVIAINSFAGYTQNLSTLLSGKNYFLGGIGTTSTFTGAAGTVAAGNGSTYRLGGGGGQITFSTTNLLTGSNNVLVGSTATNGTGTVVISNAQNYTGSTTVSTGSTLQLGAGLTGTTGGFSNNGAFIINSGSTLTQATDLNGQAISGTGTLTKAGAGTLTLSDNNTYTGKTSIATTAGPTSAGTLVVSSFNSVNGGTPLLASSSLGAPTTVANGTIDLGAGFQAGAALQYAGVTATGETTDRVLNIVFNGNTSGPRTLDASGSGLLRFTSALTSNASGSAVFTLTGNGSGQIDQGLPQLTTGGLSKAGTGTWTLGGSGSFTGPTKVTAGILNLSNATAIQLSPFDTTSATGDTTNGLKIATTTLTLGGLTGTSALDTRFTTALGGPGNATAKGGYSGLTALTLNNSSGTTSTYSGNIVDGASGMSLTKTGAGAQFLNGINSYTGLTTASAGTLGSNGSFSGPVAINTGAILAPGASTGAAGTLTISNASSSALTLNGSSLLMDVSTASSDLIAVTGTTVLNGTNTVLLNPTNNVAAGSYNLVTYAAVTGTGTAVFANGTTTLGNATLAVNAGNIQMTVGAGGLNNCVWSGATGTWDSGNNWTRNGTALQPFSAGDFVTFDDSGTTLTVTSAASVSPAQVIANNSTAKTYVITAAIGGTGTPLVKLNTGTFTLGSTTVFPANSYSGGTQVLGGILNLAGASNTDVNYLLGNTAGGITLNNGGQLKASSTNVSAARSVTVLDGGGSLFVNKNNNFTTTGKLSGSGTLTLADGGGSGTLSTYKFNNTSNDFTGGLALNNSSVELNSLADSPNNIVFTSAASNNGGSLTLNAGANSPLSFGASGRALELNSSVAVTFTITNSNTTQPISFAKDLVATGAGAKTLALSAVAGPSNVFSGNITDGTGGGTVALTKTGAGTWTLSGSNSYTGTTIISGGSLILSNTGTVAGTSGITMNTASNSLVLKSDTAFTSLPPLTGATGAFTYSIVSDRATTGAALNQQLGTMIMGNATFAFSNGSNVTSGTSMISLTSATVVSGAAGTAVLSPTSANVNITGNVTSQGNDVARTLQLDGTSTGNVIGGTITQTVASALSISKNNTSTWTLSGNNSYSGTTGVSNGTLVMSGNNTLAGQITVSGSAGTTLILSGNNSGMTSNVVLSTATGTVGNSPLLNINSATSLGTGILSFGGGLASDVVRIDNTSAGAVTVSTANAITMNRNFTFIGTQSLNLGTGAITLGGLTAGTNRIINVTANTLTLNGSISEATPSNNNGISKASAGTLVLSGTGSSYTGATNVSAGTLAGIGANAFGNTTGISVAAASTATLSLRGDSSTSFVKPSDSSPYPVTTTASGATINVDQSTVAGTGAKTMTIGTLLLNTAVTNVTNFTGANNTSLALGAVTTGNSASGTETLNNSISGSGSLTLASIAVNRTGTPTLEFAGTGNTTVTGSITEAVSTSVTKNGTGTLTFSGSNSYSGATTVSQGTLALVGASLASAVSVSSGASLGFTLGSPANSSSTVNLSSGTVKITGTPTLASYTLMTTSGITGTPALFAPIAGYALVVDGTTLKLNSTGPASPYDTWASGTFANAFTDTAPGSNPDGDTLTNLQEYAFGTDPTVSSGGPITWSGAAVTSHGSPVLYQEGGIYYAVFGRRTDYASAGLTYTVQFSADLSSPWTNSVVVPTTLATDGVIDAVKVAYPGLIPTDSGPQKARFFRVTVSQ